MQQSSKVILIEPRVYAEAQEVADHLVNRRAVLVNLQRIQHDQAIRIVDFLSGTVYAIGGDIKGLAGIFSFAPRIMWKYLETLLKCLMMRITKIRGGPKRHEFCHSDYSAAD